MSWLRRDGPSRRSADERSQEPFGEAVERSAPGVEALLDELRRDRPRAVLDLGPAVAENFRVYGRFADRIRFVDLLDVRSRRGVRTALEGIPPRPARPHDLVFAWDALDRLDSPERPLVMERIVEATAPGARLHAVFRASDAVRPPPLRFVLLESGRVRCEPVDRPGGPGPRLLPTEVEELLRPFEVIRGFTLRGQLREYVAVRP